MLLKALHDFAHRRDLLKDLAFAEKPVRWIIELDEKGNLLGAGPAQTGDGKRGKEYPCPQTTRAKNGAGVAEFLADGLTAVFGLASDPDEETSESERKTKDENNAAKRANFWQQIRRAMRETKSPQRLAMLRCWKLTRSRKQPPAFLRWGLSITPKDKEKKAWWLTAAGGTEIKLSTDSFTIRVGAELLIEHEDLKSWWRTAHALELSSLRERSANGVCLVTAAENVPLALTHRPLVSGVPGTGSFGAPIVSFDKPAFTSYGMEQSLNAPTSDEAARAYATALNWMLDHPDHHLRVGAACIVFWARETVQASSLFARFLNQPQPDAVRKFLVSPWAGMEREMAKKDEFYAVTLTGNSGRIVVKYWVQEPLESAIGHLHQWFADLDLAVPPRPDPKAGKKKPKDEIKEYNPLSIYWLACATVREAKDIKAETPAQLYRAALEGTAPPIALLKPLLDLLHSKIVSTPKEGERKYKVIEDESRFALLKLIINRHHRTRNEPTMELAPQLAETTDPAYNCGRLLSVFDNLQRDAHRPKGGGKSEINTTLAERYFGSASSNPNGVFSLMWRLHMHHLKKLRQKDENHIASAHQRKIMDICRHFTAGKHSDCPQFPRVFTLVQQGRFALGYYQQAAHEAEQARLGAERKAAKAASEKANSTAPLTEETQS